MLKFFRRNKETPQQERFVQQRQDEEFHHTHAHHIPRENNVAEKLYTTKPQILKNVLPDDTFQDLKQHIKELRRAFEGTRYHDCHEPPEMRFNRWFWHNLPVLQRIHHSPSLIELAGKTFGEPVKPSYVFLSMYGEGGICPLHVDRPQCKYTLDLCISQNEPWEIYVEDTPYVLNENEAIAYSGTDQKHYRNQIQSGNFCNLAFFHFVPVTFNSSLD